MPPTRQSKSGAPPGEYRSLAPRARTLCTWLAERDWDFRAAAAERGLEPAALYREWLESLGWNQSLAARIYRRPGTRQPVTRQAIEAQMKTFGVRRPPEITRALKGQALEGGLSALHDVHGFIAEKSSRERLCCEQLLELAQTHQQLRDHERARRALLDVVELARRIGAPELVARAIRPLVYSSFQASRFGAYNRDTIDQLDDWIVVLRESGARGPLALALSHLGFELYVSRDPAERARGVRVSAEALSLAESSGDATTLALVKCLRTLSCSGADRLDERIELLAHEVEIAEELEIDVQYSVLHTTLTDLLEAGRFEAAEVAVVRLRSIERDCTAPWPERHRAVIATFRGQWDEARRLSTPRSGGSLESAAQVLGMIQYESLKLRGEWEALESQTRWSANENPGSFMHRLLLARVMSLRGRSEAIRAEFETWAGDGFAIVRRDFMYIANLCLLAEIAHELGDRGHAETLYRLLESFRDRMVVVRVVATVRGPVAHQLGRLATTLGDFEAARCDFELARRLALEAESRPYLAWIEYDTARMLRAAGSADDLTASAEFAGDAATRARSIGMSWLARRADTLVAGASPADLSIEDPRA